MAIARSIYFEPAKMNEFNPFWEWGTLGIIVPYIGIGGEYPMELSQGDSYVSFSGGIGIYGFRIGASYAW